MSITMINIVHRVEKYYMAGYMIGDEIFWCSEAKDTAQAAYDDIGYYDKEENDCEVYEFVIDTKRTQVIPPYSG